MDNHSIYLGLIELGIEPATATQAANDYSSLELAIDAIFNAPNTSNQQSANLQDRTSESIQHSIDSTNQPELQPGLVPVCLRSSSAHLSSVGAYLQSLYHNPTYRQALKNIKTTSHQSNTINLDHQLEHDDDSIYSLQSLSGLCDLFEVAGGGEISLVGIDSACDRLGIQPTHFQHSNNQLQQLNKLHKKLATSLQYHLNSNQLTQLSPDSFQASGKSVAIDSARSIENSNQPTTSTSVIEVELDGTVDESLTIYQAMDRLMVSNDSLELITNQPGSLVLQFNQTKNSRSTQVILEPTIYLDRYSLSNAPLIADTRAKLNALKAEISQLKRDAISISQTNQKQNSVELINKAIKHLETTQPELETELTGLVNLIESKASSLQQELDSVAHLATDDSFNQLQLQTLEYQLTSFVVRNGLNGRNNCFGIVLAEDGSYYKVDDKEATKVNLDAAISDKTGLLLGAGIGLAFYQRKGGADQPAPILLRGGADIEPEPESDSEESYDGLDEDEVELGTLVKSDPTKRFDVDLDVGKVGGIPVWLDPSNPLDWNQTKCEVCTARMSFILLLNSPDDTRQFAQARTLYLFGCPTPTCNFSTKLFRTQSHSPNQFFPHNAQTIQNRAHFEGLLNPETGFVGTEVSQVVTYPEYLIETEEEPYQESYLPRINHNLIDDSIEGDDQNAPDTKVAVDRTFLEFQARISRVPDQVIRFYRLPGVEEPHPLLVSDEPLSPVSDCTLCGHKRELEFQVVATLLSFLNDDNLQFDSLLVYTCSQNCDLSNQNPPPQTGWAQEQVIKQSYSRQGVEFQTNDHSH